MSITQTMAVQEFQTLPFAWSWRNVLRAAAIGQLLLLLTTIVTLRDLLAAGLAVILLVGLSLFILRDKMFGFIFEMVARVIFWHVPEEKLGALVLGFLFADIGFYTLTGAASNLIHGAHGAAVLLPASLAAFSVIGLVAAIQCVWKPTPSYAPNHTAVNFVASILVVWAVVMGIGLLGGTRTARVLPPSDIRVVTENMGYSKTALNARPGQVIVELENHDLFWHTFTVPELNVDMKVPVQATQQVRFDAPAGTYKFLCTTPGHEMLGMTGMLTVK